MTQGSEQHKRTSISQLRSFVRSIPYLTIFAGVVFAFVGIWPYVSYSKAERDFLRGVKSRISDGLASFPVSDVANFDWDTVCLFYGMDEAPIQDQLAKASIAVPSQYLDKIKKADDTSDTRLYVFAMNGKATELVFVPSTHVMVGGKAYRLIGVECAAAKDAIFTVSNQGKKRTLALSERENVNGS